MWRELSLRNDSIWINQYAKRAALLGPFPADGKPKCGIDEPFIDETKVVPRIGDKVSNLEWTLVVFENDKQWAPGSRGTEVNYLAISVQSETEQEVQIRVGADDLCRVWLNGKVVLFGDHCVPPDSYIEKVTLARGRNLFLMKVANGGGPTGASFRLTAPGGGLLNGVKYVE
jgi:hypothetical protein